MLHADRSSLTTVKCRRSWSILPQTFGVLEKIRYLCGVNIAIDELSQRKERMEENERYKTYPKRWVEAVDKMGMGKLSFIVNNPVGFYPEYVELAKERWRKLSRLSGQRQLKSQIKIADYAWRTVDLDDREEVERVKHAVNYTNRLAYVTTYYTINEEKELMSVHSTTSIHDSSMIPNMKEYLHNILRCFFAAYELLNTELLVLKREDAGRKDYADSNLQYGLGLGEMPTC